jgi:hypothetical protein
MGDRNNGTHRIDLAFTERIDNADTPVLFNYQVINKGHGDTTDQAIDAALNAGAKWLATEIVGEDNIGTDVLTRLFSWIGGFLNPDCDGPLAADQIKATGAELRNSTARTGFHREQRYYPGVDSADGCGGNSQYYVTWSVRRK